MVLEASMGLQQLNKPPTIVEKRKHNHSRLVQIFAEYRDYFILPKATIKSDPSWFAFAVTITDSAPFKRKDIVDFFESNKIQTRPYFAGNIMLQPAYSGLVDKQKVITEYPNARKVTTDTFFLGTSPIITDEQIDYIQNTLRSFIKGLKT